ncbi:MAG: DUF2857 family protein [Burkholderiales bacterium]|nr:DUF2857 family protein [Burkholderiales bacterium]
MMLPLSDTHVRLILLNHIAVRLTGCDSADIRAAGIETEQLQHLRELSAPDLHRLAAMREPMIAVSIDSRRLKAGLRALTLTNEVQAMETYFIRHGASWTMMKRLFKLRHKLTLQRRREYGVRRPPGRTPLPDVAIRKRIWQVWAAIGDSDPRARYFRLQQAFPNFSLDVLGSVIAKFEKDR